MKYTKSFTLLLMMQLDVDFSKKIWIDYSFVIFLILLEKKKKKQKGNGYTLKSSIYLFTIYQFIQNIFIFSFLKHYYSFLQQGLKICSQIRWDLVEIGLFERS